MYLRKSVCPCQIVTANSNSSSCNEATVDQVSERGESTIESGRKFQFSFAQKPTENTGGLHQEDDIRRNYYMIRNFEKENILINKHDSDSEISSIRCNYHDKEEDYRRTESLLFDRVFLKNRVQSGSLHLCGGGGGGGGGIAISFLPFASLI